MPQGNGNGKAKRLLLLLLAPLTLLTAGCGVAYRTAETLATDLAYSGLWRQGRRGPLSETERQWAATAWAYFEKNYQPSTGFVNSVDRYPAVTMWHVADYIAALYSARALSLIDERTYDERITKLLHQLNVMPLAFNQLPNAAYNAQTGAMADFANQPGETGWSIIDIGRLMLWLAILKADAEHFSEYIDRIILRWNFCNAITDDGVLKSAVKIQDRLQTIEEQAIGYADYAQFGFRLWGLDTPSRWRSDPENEIDIYGVKFAYDSSLARRQGSYGALLSTPYLLLGLETNWESRANYGAVDGNNAHLEQTADKIYRVQELRYKIEGVSTARTDHQLGRPPFYLQNSIFAEGYAWTTISDDGVLYPELALISTRAVFGMWALWDTPYTDHLMTLTRELFEPGRGWFEGRYETHADYERTITISTNAMVLTALLFKQNGPLYKPFSRGGYVEHRLSDKFFHPENCLPVLAENKT